MGFDESDVDQCWESWRDLFLNAVESFIPKIKLKDAKSPRWADGEIIKLSRKKKRLLKQAKQSNSAVHWDNYGSIRKQIKTVTKRNIETLTSRSIGAATGSWPSTLTNAHSAQ